MKKLINKVLNLPIPYVITFITVILISIMLSIQGSINIYGITGVLLVGILLILQLHFGSVVIKSVLATMMTLYITSLYTGLTMEIHGFIVQPFLLTISAVTAFLAQTYSTKHYNFGLKSKQLGTIILVITLVSLKLSIILNGMSFWIAEVIGLNYLVIFIILWRLSANISKKTKVINPILIKENTEENFKYIYIQNRLDVINNKWLDLGSKKQNSLPYLYSEVLKANELNKLLVIVSSFKDNQTFDVGEIEINRSKKIPYLYMESKSGKYKTEILNKFEKEVELRF